MSSKRIREAGTNPLVRAIELHRQGKLDEAESRYRQLAKSQPGNPDVWHFLGLLMHGRGNVAVAIEYVEKATTMAPRYVDALNNLGNLFKIAGRLADAEAAYRRAIALRPADANAHSNLGVILKLRGNLIEAESTLRKAIDLDQRHIPAYVNLGNLLRRLGRPEEALACNRAAVAFDPDHPDAPKMLGLAYQASGQIDKAREVFELWLKRDPGNPIAAHMLSACSGTSPLTRASDDYVRTVFDEMADSFDEHLADLDYRAPQLIERALSRVRPLTDGSLDVLDAGCGTGLCASFLRPHARNLVGVDLSSGMLRHAKSLDRYDELIESELTAYVERQADAFDVIVSADTLCYFGALDGFCRAVAHALRPGGHLLFTLENAADDPESGFRIETHGRYSHDEAYVRRALSHAGLGIDHFDHADLRMECGKPVAGLVVTAVRPGH